MKLNVLGTEYDLQWTPVGSDVGLEGKNGYCDITTKQIVIADNDEVPRQSDTVGDLDFTEDEATRHEIVHAALYESGMGEYFQDENIVSWIAIQAPKLLHMFLEAGAMSHPGGGHVRCNSQFCAVPGKVVAENQVSDLDDHSARGNDAQNELSFDVMWPQKPTDREVVMARLLESRLAEPWSPFEIGQVTELVGNVLYDSDHKDKRAITFITCPEKHRSVLEKIVEEFDRALRTVPEPVKDEGNKSRHMPYDWSYCTKWTTPNDFPPGPEITCESGTVSMNNEPPDSGFSDGDTTWHECRLQDPRDVADGEYHPERFTCKTAEGHPGCTPVKFDGWAMEELAQAAEILKRGGERKTASDDTLLTIVMAGRDLLESTCNMIEAWTQNDGAPAYANTKAFLNDLSRLANEIKQHLEEFK